MRQRRALPRLVPPSSRQAPRNGGASSCSTARPGSSARASTTRTSISVDMGVPELRSEVPAVRRFGRSARLSARRRGHRSRDRRGVDGQSARGAHRHLRRERTRRSAGARDRASPALSEARERRFHGDRRSRAHPAARFRAWRRRNTGLRHRRVRRCRGRQTSRAPRSRPSRSSCRAENSRSPGTRTGRTYLDERPDRCIFHGPSRDLVSRGVPTSMSTQTARGLAAGQTDEERIERYLSLNPDFFERHQPLLARMRLPHMRTGSTVSLVERQVEVLREQKTDADRRLAEFIAVARANDTLADRIHRFTRRLLRAPTARRGARPRSKPSLREDFDAFHSVLLLTAPIDSAAQRRATNRSCAAVAPDDANIRSFEALLATGKPRCGQVRDTQRDFLFGPESREHRLGRAGAAGRRRRGRPARARQRRTRTLPSGHEHRVPEAHGRADHGRALAAVDGWRRSLSSRGTARSLAGSTATSAHLAHRAASLAAHRV